jgi:hypothetical protein
MFRPRTRRSFSFSRPTKRFATSGRLQADLQATPILAGLSAASLSPILQKTNLANAILVRLEPWAGPNAIIKSLDHFVGSC